MKRLRMVKAVTPEQGEAFVKGYLDRAFEGLEMIEAFGETGILTWPIDDAAGQHRYQAIEDEILERTFEAVRSALAEAFVRVANEVLDRERKL